MAPVTPRRVTTAAWSPCGTPRGVPAAQSEAPVVAPADVRDDSTAVSAVDADYCGGPEAATLVPAVATATGARWARAPPAASWPPTTPPFRCRAGAPTVPPVLAATRAVPILRRGSVSVAVICIVGAAPWRVRCARWQRGWRRRPHAPWRRWHRQPRAPPRRRKGRPPTPHQTHSPWPMACRSSVSGAARPRPPWWCRTAEAGTRRGRRTLPCSRGAWEREAGGRGAAARREPRRRPHPMVWCLGEWQHYMSAIQRLPPIPTPPATSLGAPAGGKPGLQKSRTRRGSSPLPTFSVRSNWISSGASRSGPPLIVGGGGPLTIRSDPPRIVSATAVALSWRRDAAGGGSSHRRRWWKAAVLVN